MNQQTERTITVVLHQPRRWNRQHTECTCWCGIKLSADAEDATPPADATVAVEVSCPLCECARVVDHAKLKDMFTDPKEETR